MEYFYDKNESILLVKTNPQKFSEMKKLSELLMPEIVDGRGVGFNSSGLMSLNEFISYTTEKDLLYFVFFLFKAMNEWADKSDSKLELILDTNAIFYEQKKNRFCFAATTEKNNINAIEFATDLIFNAIFKEKELQTAVELISFIRASIHTNARDILLFLEMSKYGRAYTSDWTKFKKTFENTTVGHTESLADAHKNSKMTHKVNNSMDFSDFLSVDDLFSDADSSSEESTDIFEEKVVPEEKIEEVQKETVFVPFIDEVQEEEAADVPFAEEVQEEEAADVPFAEEVQEEEAADVPFVEEVQEEAADVPFVEEVQEEAADVPFVEEVQEEAADVPFIEEVQEEAADVPFVEEVQEEAADVPFVEEVQEEAIDSYPVGYDTYTDIDDDIEDQTMILEEEDMPEETLVAYLKGSDGTIVEISKDYFVIGRNSKESDFAVRDSSMSRKHAAIIRIDNEFYIEDLNSTNKTYLDNEQILPNVRKLLSDGSVIFVSRNKYIFNVERR